MRWEDERWVKSYTRDTTDWLALSFEAQGVWLMLLRKFDRAGVLDLGRHGKRGIAIAIGHAHRWRELEPAIDELLEDGCLVIQGNKAIAPNFIEAQEAKSSNAARKRAQRERDRDFALAGVDPRTRDADATNCHDESRPVTKRDIESQNVTRSHAKSREVTPRVDETRVDETRRTDLSADADDGELSVPTVAEVADALFDPASPVDQPLLVAVPSPPEPKPPSRAEQARQVFEHWRKRMGKNGRTEFDAKRRRAVEERLKGGYSVEDLCRAIDGCALTPWNNGTETGKRYDDIELICRSAAHVDRFIANATDPPKPRSQAAAVAARNPAVDAAYYPRDDW